jgi:glyoxylase-like metal-dependent hydrolase (beta-lactamase superfamily II)
MGLKIRALHIGDGILDWSFLLRNYNPGRKTCTPINSFLILGAESPILVDTGVRDPKLLEPSGIREIETPEQDIVRLLREHGLEPRDIRYIIFTHLDPDHTGKAPLFPNAKLVIQRKEMAFHAAGYGHATDLPWLINNMNRIEFIDGDIELFSGVKCVLAIAHTGGHQHIEVDTEDGKAIICGDTVYDIPMQLEERVPGRMWPSGNCHNQALLQDLLYRLKKELQRGALILPAHSYEVYDRYHLGKKLSDKRRDYEGFPSLDWPPNNRPQRESNLNP